MSSMSLLMKRKIIFEKIRCIITLILSDFELSAQLYRRIPILNVSFDTICSLHSQITQDEREDLIFVSFIFFSFVVSLSNHSNEYILNCSRLRVKLRRTFAGRTGRI